MYLIWSFGLNAWWAPDRCGYTESLDVAGRYSKTESGEIVTDSFFLDEVAIVESIAIANGPPAFHPYAGQNGGGDGFDWERK